MLLDWIRPGKSAGCDVDGLGGVNALEPRLVLAPPEVAAASDEELVVFENWHPVNVTRAFTAIGAELVDVGLWCVGIEVELEHFFQMTNLPLWRRFSQGFKGIHHSIPAAEENKFASVHLSERWLCLGVVENICGNVLVITAKKLPSVLVNHHEARCVRRADAFVRFIHTVGGA